MLEGVAGGERFCKSCSSLFLLFSLLLGLYLKSVKLVLSLKWVLVSAASSEQRCLELRPCRKANYLNRCSAVQSPRFSWVYHISVDFVDSSPC